mgnify:CR=1 FL=1
MVFRKRRFKASYSDDVALVVTVLRHAESENNARADKGGPADKEKESSTGSSCIDRKADPSLTETGTKQAVLAGRRIADEFGEAVAAAAAAAGGGGGEAVVPSLQVWTSPMLRACQTAQAVANAFGPRRPPDGGAPPAVFVRKELMEVHGPLCAENGKGTPGGKSQKVYSSAAKSTRSWCDLISQHSGFQRWPPSSSSSSSSSSALSDSSSLPAAPVDGAGGSDYGPWCGTDGVETEEAATVRAEDLFRELKTSAQSHPEGQPSSHIVLVTHAIFIGCFTRAVFGHPFSQYNAGVTKLKITRGGNVQCEFANSVLHLAGDKFILPKGVGGGLL